MASVTLEQKKLEQLKQQLFGKDESTYKLNSKQAPKPSNITGQAAMLDSISLKSDLIKISALSLLALAIQFSLFFANRNGLINLF